RMDATQMINESILESDEEENKEESKKKRGNPLAKLCILKNEHIPETELPLFLGENVLGRDPNTCTLPVPSPSISKQHAIICISVYRRRGHSGTAMEALVWDLGSLNGTRKGRLKLTPHVRYALSECESLVLADIPCQYVSWAADTVSSQDDLKTPVSKSSGIEARLSEFLEEKESVNRAMKARVSLPDQEDMRKTPVRTICLSFAQTPAQPQGTLVPESDLDSDEDRVCDSDSYKSSPTCSTFLSPSTKIVPESEDESPITPSSLTKNRSHQHVSFRREQERAALEGRQSEESGRNGPVNQENNVGLRREDELPASTTAVVTDEIPALHMDSDTDIEGEEEEVVASAVPVTLNANQQADNTSNTAQFLMDSDTDVEETADALDKVSDPVPSYDNTTKPLQVVPVIQPDGTAMDSDTDVDDDVSLDAASKAKPVLFQGTHTADSAPSTQPMHFYLDSDTDLDEEKEEKEKELVTRSDIKPVGPESATAAHHSLHMDSETDDEATTKACTTANTCADLEILSDSDTDVKDDFPEVIPSAVTPLSFTPATVSEAVQPDSDAGTDVDEPIVPPAGDIAKLGDPQVDSETDVEDEVDFGMAGEDHVPMLLDDENFAVAETQSFVLRAKHCQGSPSEGHVMEPTQAFGLESSGDDKSKVFSRGGSFQLGLSESSHMQDRVQTLATQAFVSVDDIQAYADRNFSESDSNMEATQAHGKDEESARGQVTPETEGKVDLALEATQAYISDSYCDSEDEPDDGKRNTATTENRPFNLPTSSTLAMAETQPLSAFKKDEILDKTNPVSSVPRPQNETEQRKDQLQTSFLTVAETQPMCASDDEESDDEDSFSGLQQRKTKPLQLEEEQTQPFTCCELSFAETQPMHISIDESMATSGNEASDEDNSVTLPQNRRAKTLKLGQEKTQTLTNSELSAAETQPMVKGENEESDEEDSIPGPRRRRPKALKLEEEETQTLTNSELSAVETQPMVKGENEESDEEDSIPGPRRRRPKALKLEEEETQTLTNSERSAVETQPMVKGEDGESDEVDTVTVTQKRNAKPLQIQENETKPLMNSEASTFKTQRPQRGKTGQDDVGTSGITTRGRRGTRATLREEPSECAEPPKRQTRGTNKAYTTTRGRTGKSRPDEGDKEKEKVEQTKQAKEKRSIMQQNEEEKDNHDKNVQEEGRLGEEEDATVLRQQEGEKTEKESRETDKRQREQEESQQRREEEKKLERERKEKEEQEKMQAENAERLRLECERAKKETMERARKERKEKETAERIRKDKEEQLEREQKGKEDKERLELEKVEREEKARIENQRKEQEEKEKVEVEELLKRTTAVLRTAEPEQDSTISAKDDVPARRTRSRSNSSNSVSSERSTSSVLTHESKGRGRSRGANRRTSEPPAAVMARSSNRRKTELTERNSNDVSRGVLSRSNSSNSLNSERRGGRQRERGRKTEADSVPPVITKTPRSSSASPAAGGRSRAATQTYKVLSFCKHLGNLTFFNEYIKKQNVTTFRTTHCRSFSQVLFTGVVDEAGERVLTRLGGSLAKGVADMNCLVTDKVRRTVKFLCAVAKGVPVVTTQWLEKCGKAGVFLSPSSFIVKDLEQENKFNFCLQESVKVASNQPLLQGYEIHVTKSVKPEPVQMKDILTCSGATFLPKMPSFHKPQTVVISCEEDWLLCGVASSASIPVVTAEFILTGILQQKLDFQTHALPAPAINPQPAGGRGRSRKKT
uniref:Mediator of DNA damage checkpoint protein 1 n=1 Tax=Mola mola TaxID=94237 RepID=A0A3Q3WYV9_MOLML